MDEAVGPVELHGANETLKSCYQGV